LLSINSIELLLREKKNLSTLEKYKTLAKLNDNFETNKIGEWNV
jgi:hypothetical protein